MLAFIRRHKKGVSLFFLFHFLTGSFLNQAYALSSGPSSPETQQFAPAGVDNMVDPFTGDFSYNIPLMDVGGYPVNINYASGISPDAEASWVGLGWNLNVGAINRSVRGLPDDFSGDSVTKEYNVMPNQTYGVTGHVNFEILGAQLGKNIASLGLNANLFYNTYNGFGMSLGASPSVSAGNNSKGPFTGTLGLSASVGSESGLEVTPTAGLKFREGSGNEETTINASIGFPFSTREGLKGMTMSGSFSSTSNASYVDKTSKETASTDVSNGGISRSSFKGFAGPTYTPSLEHNTYNVNASLNFSFSPTNPVWENPAFGFGGYYSGQFLKSTSRTSPAYGYMYSGIDPSDSKLLDFNREKEGTGFNKFTTNLPLTNFTYDIYQVSGQGVGGTYRLYRGDIGAVHDPVSTDQGYSPSLGIEIGVGTPPSTKIGVDATFNYSQSYSGRWPDGGINHFNSENATALNTPGKEMVYFKKIGEDAPENDANFLTNIQKDYRLFRHNIVYGGDQGGFLTGQYDVRQPDGSFSQEGINSSNMRTVRRPRVTSFTALNVKEAKQTNVCPIQSYGPGFVWQYRSDRSRVPAMSNLQLGYPKTTIARDASGRRSHHTSEVRVTDNTGARYVYGIPVYNNVQEDVTFAMPGSSANATSGTISYTPNTDDVSGNNNGLDHYFNKVTTPPYATSFLLTAVLSADYVDSDNIPGPSDGDLGTYTKFNYSKVISTFRWRTPFSATPGVASFSEGIHGTPNDDKANYVYGEKEIWYLHSIETRTHVAEFYLKDRLDGLGAAGREGSVDEGNRLQCLDKVVLYSKPDKTNSKAEPVKTVHFEYDYSLCPGTPNSKVDATLNPNQGKLTLRKIWFTYGNSQKGVLNPYVFTYADQNFDGVTDNVFNPSYSPKNYDRWGNYKQDNSSGISNAEFPYTIQDKPTADQYAAAYALSSIKTPTGGTMRVYYESDDYAYVQNKQAMRMFKMLGAASSAPATPGLGTYGSSLYSGTAGVLTTSNNYIAIDLGEGFTPTGAGGLTPNDEFRQKYLSGIDMTYYKVLMTVIKPGGGLQQRDEFVPGYASIDPSSSVLITNGMTGSTYKQALIKLNPVSATPGGSYSPDVNPIIRAGWMFARLNLNRELNGSGNTTDSGLEDVLRALLAQARTVATMLINFSTQMILSGHSQNFDPTHSFIRLKEPDKIKIGGGHRVKAIVMADNWDLMKSAKEQKLNLASKEASYYGQAYDYTYNENGQVISAGVAAYEPMMGGEENPFRLPVFVREKTPLAPSKEYYLEEPFGESFFPAPSVGYRQVVVTPLKITAANLAAGNFTGNGTGRVEHEFYTAYDFPTITRRTDLHTERHAPGLINQFMKFDSKDKVTCTQGYYVELNDMHGKQKAQRVYPEYRIATGVNTLAQNTPISEVEYRYVQNADGTLNNQVPYVSKDLTITSAGNGVNLGVDVDVVQDERYFESTTLGGGLQFNLKYIQAAVVPLFIPTPFPDFTNEQTGFRSIVTTKVVNKYGIVQSTTARDNGASITTRNLAWDSKTGQVLLTSVENEFHDLLYTFTYPGHWAYKRMDLAASNEGMSFNNPSDPIVAGALRDGDEVYCKQSGGQEQVAYCFDGGSSKWLIDRSGTPITNLAEGKVIRSGSRNMPATPVGTVVCLDNPIQSGSNTLVFSRVLNAGVSEFGDVWNRSCNCTSGAVSGSNPFIKGTGGNIRPLRSLTYLTNRTQSSVNNNLNIRNDGYFADSFIPFWSYSAASGYLSRPSLLQNTKWQFVTEIQRYNMAGMEIENRDALNRYSMAQFGYGRNLPVATSNNSRYRESGYDGFEDYQFGDCQDDHFSWRTYPSNVTNEESHTGRNSIKVGKNSEAYINKTINPCSTTTTPSGQY